MTHSPRRSGALDSGAVVWVRGEHDISTVGALTDTLARAIAFDSTEVVVDLSGVQFMDAATVSVIVRTREYLRERQRALVLRSPSTSAKRIFDLCELSDLFDVSPDAPTSLAEALESWVAVPRSDRHGATPEVPTEPSVEVFDSGEVTGVPAVRPRDVERATEVPDAQAP
ncbi:MAG TPA: STAS domain-containing protein [Acidimicrobiia bacterium]|nr:STAS domain-containing protein [Acidimicrobiia bacterium]